MADVLADPLIRLMIRADHVPVETMKALLADAARKQSFHLGNRRHQHVAKNLPTKSHPVTHPQLAGIDAQTSLWMPRQAFDGRIVNGNDIRGMGRRRRSQ